MAMDRWGSATNVNTGIQILVDWLPRDAVNPNRTQPIREVSPTTGSRVIATIRVAANQLVSGTGNQRLAECIETPHEVPAADAGRLVAGNRPETGLEVREPMTAGSNVA